MYYCEALCGTHSPFFSAWFPAVPYSYSKPPQDILSQKVQQYPGNTPRMRKDSIDESLEQP